MIAAILMSLDRAAALVRRKPTAPEQWAFDDEFHGDTLRFIAGVAPEPPVDDDGDAR
jgi:hypothetical protein